MKMMMCKIAALVGGMGLVGYMYLKKHPETVQMMREMGKDASRMMYNKLDQYESEA